MILLLTSLLLTLLGLHTWRRRRLGSRPATAKATTASKWDAQAAANTVRMIQALSQSATKMLDAGHVELVLLCAHEWVGRWSSAEQFWVQQDGQIIPMGWCPGCGALMWYGKTLVPDARNLTSTFLKQDSGISAAGPVAEPMSGSLSHD